jgi:hypothetical protein
MSMEKEVDAQSMCERLLEMDHRVMYSSFLDARGSIIGEATRNTISNCNFLTIMYVPIGPGKDSLVLATLVGSELSPILQKARRILAPYSMAQIIAS